MYCFYGSVKSLKKYNKVLSDLLDEGFKEADLQIQLEKILKEFKLVK